MSSTEESDVVEPWAFFPILDLKDYDIAEKTIHYIQVNHIFGKPTLKNAEAKENLKKADLNSMIDLETLIHKTSVEPKLLQLKKCVRNKNKERAPKKSLRFSTEQPNDSVC